ncbi:MAG: response regulator [Muribaculum sp.]|nr:response regulator [Muribaculum sp.]
MQYSARFDYWIRLLVTVLVAATGSMHSVFAQDSDTYNYRYYRAADGLCDEYVFHILRDSRGFMWFCTSNGLDRFDGNAYIHYCTLSPTPDQRTKSNYFVDIVEDNAGNLWAASDVGIMRISAISGKAEPLTEIYDRPDAESLFGRGVDVLSKDHIGSLWLGSGDEAFCLRLSDSGEVESVSAMKPRCGTVRAFGRQDNAIWVGGESGLSRFMMVSDGNWQEVPIEHSSPLSEINDVCTIMPQGIYLNIGTFGNGFFRYNTRSHELKHYIHDINDSGSIVGDYVTGIDVNSSGDLVIGTRSGISIFTHGNKFVNLQASGKMPSLNNNFVNHVFVDDDDNVWVATSLGGVNLIYLKKSRVKPLFNSPDELNVVTSVYLDRDGNIWGGISGRGLVVARPDDDYSQYECFQHSASNPNSLSDDNIMDIIQDESGGLWIGTRGGGLNYMPDIDSKKPVFIRFNTENSDLMSNSVRRFALDSVRGGIWLCCDRGVQFLNTTTREFFDLSEFIGVSPDMSNMMALMLDDSGRLWVGGDGLYIIDLNRLREFRSDAQPYFYSRYKLDKPDSGISERIGIIRQMPDSTVYIGSHNNGLYLCNFSADGTPEFFNYPMVFGSKICNILRSNDRCMWISTIDGVYYIDMQTLRTTKYDVSDGLVSNQFYIRSGVEMPDGRVCLGSIAGAVVIDPPSNMDMTYNRKVDITYVLSDATGLYNLQDSVCVLGPDENSFEIGFSAREYTNPDKIIYAYKIDELDSDWNFEKNSGKIRYTGLKPGKYTFSITCANADNIWSPNHARLHIVIKAPFYQTWWFICLSIICILGIAGIAVYIYYRRQKSVQKLLVAKVQQRTRRLTEQTEQLMRKNEEISEQKTRIEEISKQIEHTNKEKLMMFTSLTHEFKTPLTLILGPARKLIEGNDNPSLNENIQIINRNAHHLLSLVNQIMDLRMIDAKHLYLNNAAFNLMEEFDGDMAAFSDLLGERNIEFSTRVHVGTELIVSDRSFMHKILFNLLSNAIKYTPNGGRIVCRMGQRPAGSQNTLWQFVSVSNTGSYISPEECERIFDCFYKIENQKAYTSYGQSSTGIGLYLVKELVTALGGHISVKSIEGKGTTFRVCFPVKAASESPVVANRGVEESVQLDSNFDDIPFDEPDERDKPVVLLVEDSRDMRGYIKGILGDKYYVAEAINGERGYALAQKISPDFIISDLMMPVCDGLEFCRMIRSDSELCHIPFVMLTALSDYDSRFESYKVKVDAYLTKPFEPEMLLARLDAILTNRNNQQKVIIQDLSNPYPTVEMEDSDKTFLKKLVEVMRANYSNPDFSVASLVDMMGMSAPKLYHKIIALTGMSAVSYIRLYRLQTAKGIMEENRGKKGVSVSEVAYLVGFNDPKYFTRCFVKQFGVQPRTFINEG